MREITSIEMQRVAGAGDDCPEKPRAARLGSITDDPDSQSLTEVYQSVVQTASDLIEKVANALK